MLIAFVFIRFFITDSEKEEDFPEFKEMEAAKTSHELNAIEHLLKNIAFQEKFTRYFQRVLLLNGKRDGGAIFHHIARKLIDPIALKEYSWKGQKRAKSDRNFLSFQASFPNLIEFVNSILCRGDSGFVNGLWNYSKTY